MKKDKIIYWASTSVVSVVILVSALFFCFSSEAAAFAHLGFPAYFRIELTVAKLLGFAGLVIPNLPHKVKEFSYFGLAIVISSAVIAHFCSGDGVAALDPLFFLIVLGISYYYYHKLRDAVAAGKKL